MNKIMELAIGYASDYANGGGDKSALQAEVTRLEAEQLKLHASLAESVLHAQAGWARYENANNLVKGYQTELAELRARLAALDSEIDPLQARYPAGVMSTILKKAMAVVEAGGRAEYVRSLDALRVEADRMEAELEAMVAENHKLSDLWSAMKKERDELRAKLAALEAQEPVAQVHASNILPIPDGTEWCREVLLYSPNNEGDCFQGVNTRLKLYLAAGTKEKP